MQEVEPGSEAFPGVQDSQFRLEGEAKREEALPDGQSTQEVVRASCSL